jgi:hypothetical protein
MVCLYMTSVVLVVAGCGGGGNYGKGTSRKILPLASPVTLDKTPCS